MPYDGQIYEVALTNGALYEIVDQVARAQAGGGIIVRGVSATPLTDAATTNPINLAVLTTSQPADWSTNYTDYYIYNKVTHEYSHPEAGSSPTWYANTYYKFESLTATANDAVFYINKEFIFDGTLWHEFGDMTGLGALAYKDSGSVTLSTSSATATVSKAQTGTATYTPTGTVDTPTISLKSNGAGATTTVNSITAVGTLPSWTGTVSNGRLTFSWSAGTLPTKGEDTTVKTGDGQYEASSMTSAFHGDGARLVTDSITIPTTGPHAVTFT